MPTLVVVGEKLWEMDGKICRNGKKFYALMLYERLTRCYH